jgi:DNA-binding Lrp family transcriptional regulator
LRPRESQAQPDPSENTVALVKLVTEIGPDIAEISRRLGQFKESVRYRYKEKIVRRGFQIKADLDYGALGLTRVVMKLRFAEAHGPRAREIFEAMNDLCYVVAYAGTLPDGVYIAHAAVPTELTTQFHLLMESLKHEGIFSAVEFFDCEWFRVVPMRAECFDFDEGVWDFDWSKPPQVDRKEARATISEKRKLDKVDLLLLKELAKDSDRSLTEIQAEIKKVNKADINYKTLGWHYTHHVLGQHLIRDYSIAWHRMTYNLTEQRIERMGKHGYLGISLIVKRTSDQDKMMLRSQLNRLPFLWSEAAGDAYYSQLFFPLDMANEAIEYIKKLLGPYNNRAEMFLLDQSQVRTFTISHSLWDEQRQRWTFDTEGLAPRLKESVLSLRSSTSGG